MLNEDSSSFEAVKFFQDCRNELSTIVQKGSLSKKIARAERKIAHIQQSQKTIELDRMLLNNIVIDYMRSYKLDYSYSVFMRECNMLSEDIASKRMLAQMVDVSKQFDKDQRFNVSLVELMIQAISAERSKGKSIDYGIQVDTLHKTGQPHHMLLLENKIREVREDVEQREKRYYEKMLQSMRSTQILSLRQEITKQFEKKHSEQFDRVNKKYQQLIKKTKANENPDKLKEEIDRLLIKNHELLAENAKFHEQNKQLMKQKISHSCSSTKQWKELEAFNREERLALEKKKQELDLALRNISTKVEDLVAQKKKAEGESNANKFMEEKKVQRQNKDYMIETIFGEMKHMSKRLELLGQENKNLRKQAAANMKKINEQRQELREADPNLRPTNQPAEASGRYRANQPANQNIEFCNKCKTIDLAQKFKLKTKDVNCGVCENDLILPAEQVEVYEQSSSESGEDIDELELQQREKIAKLQSDMRLIKKKIRMLVQDF